ncbi:putative secondary metabolism biosynthetic enzyme [Bacidia gigantensis]|uniref:putative secondary metabolism biosynthetic enzyme n=1 Tax=Bacidia gigantensis TaxID=2732470 RepID=UPI001D04E0A5|nr:putative secondary metabolism biosynthetic enzyme [Bacidia gigantensis]KAG8525581.1 putative secondary metabolism biosynthetic enzyme [Bacidia gigantensis]
MASACAESIYKHFQTDLTDTTILVKAMDMQESLIITDGPAPQIMRIDAKYSQKSKNIEIQITSGGKDGQPTKMHAKTTVVLNDVQKEKKDLQSKLGPVMPKIQQVKDDVSEGLADRFTTSMAYRMVASLAHYDDSHKGVKESCLNSSTMEGHSIIATPERHRLQGDFSVHPCVFDSILQLATFVTNAHENSKFEQEVYVVKGWDNMFIDQRLSLKEQYETYVKMNTSNKEVGVGDILITKGGNLIGCIEGVRVTRVPRRLMDVMFKPKTEAPSARQPAKQNAELQAIATEMRKKPAGPSKLDRALAIISEESGILIPEMKDGDFFADLGIDSLLILVIASRFREELTLDLSASFFVDVDSIGAIRKYFNDLESPEEIVEVPVTATATEVPTTDGPLKLDTALSIIAEESGISIPEMKDEDYLSDLGIDSLLLLVIASRFREELSLDLSASFFADVDSIGAIKNYFKSLDAPSTGAITPESQDDSDSASSQSGRSTPSEATTASEAPEPTPAPKNPNAKPPRSTSILLQGTITPTTKTMFLFPDGSGSATSYMHLPRVDSSVAVVAMNCPYMTTPTQMTGTFEDITALLLAEVRRRQPHGPYYIGGWSAGGAFAHYAARMLIDAGEEVKALLLIDAPAPIGLGKLPESFFKYWREIHQPGGIAQDHGFQHQGVGGPGGGPDTD